MAPSGRDRSLVPTIRGSIRVRRCAPAIGLLGDGGIRRIAQSEALKAFGSCLNPREAVQAGQAATCCSGIAHLVLWIAIAMSRYHASEYGGAADSNSCSVPQKLQRAKQLMNANSKKGFRSGAMRRDRIG